MIKPVRNTLRYAAILMPAAFRTAVQQKWISLVLCFFMFFQNMLMFGIWVIYFNNFSNMNGWQLADLATLYGLGAFSVGLAFLLCGGTQEIGRAIMEGDIDVYLGRPRHPLVGLLFRKCRVEGLGDVLTTPVLFLVFADYSPFEFFLLMLLGICSAVIVLATTLMINCLPFYVAQLSRLTDQMLESFIILSLYPHHGFSVGVRLLLLTLVPAGFVAYLPIEAIRRFDPMLMALMTLAAVFYMTIAVVIFNHGLRHYSSGNKLLSVQ